MEHPDTGPQPAELPETEEQAESQEISELMLGDLEAENPGQPIDPLLRALLALC